MLGRELQLDQFWSKRLGVSGKEPALAKAGGTHWDQVLFAGRLPPAGAGQRMAPAS